MGTTLLVVMPLMAVTGITTWKIGIALLGLCWDFLGALLFGGGLLMRHMASVGAGLVVTHRDDIASRLAVKIAVWVGLKPRDSDEWMVDEYTTAFWATFLLGFGFVFQAVSQLIP